MSNIFNTTCYACEETIYGVHNSRGGVFYVDNVKKGIYHKNTCVSGYFNDAVQSNSVPLPRHLKISDENQLQLFPETKICRLCWNTNGWVSPTGWEDKAKPGSYEDSYGYGHEEWIFDMDKVMDDGYHYGFLEPVNKFHEKYTGRSYKFILYTIKGTTQQKYWIGKLNNVEVINKVKSKEIAEIYKSNGWLDLMKKDLFNYGLDYSNFDNVVKENLMFNVRFRPEEYKNIYRDIIEIENDSVIKSPRYTLMDFDENTMAKDVKIHNGLDFHSGINNTDDLVDTATMHFTSHEKELPLKHNRLIKGFFKYMKKLYGNNVSRECRTAGNRRVDITRETDDGYVLYEIKTYNHLETSLRVALGQLIEYSCYPERMDAIEMYLVSDIEPMPDTIKYIKFLNKVLNIKFGYIQFDLKTNVIASEIS